MPQIIGSDVSSLRHVNRDGALQHLRRTPDSVFTASDIADGLGLSRPTAARLLTELSESGWATLELAHSGSAGRPTRTFTINRRRRLVAALDLGANNLLAAVADLSGTVLRRHYAPHGHPGSAELMAQQAAAALLRLVEEETGPHGGLSSVVVSLPATVDRDGRILPWSDSPAWATAALPSLLGELLQELPGLRLRFEGVPLAAAEAELQHGELQAGEDAVFVLAGDITGVAPLIEGRPYRGATGAAGAIGGLDSVDWRAATAAVLEETGAQTLDELVASGLAGDSDAAAALSRYAEHLAPGVEVLVRAFDPARLVLGGCLAPAQELVLGPLGAALGRTLGTTPTMVCASVDHVDAPMLGGLSAALDHVEWGTP
ncbi:ROK family transcriptional regulator [Galactobacter valiniphilus]|uniref:ROK family transcriptional regulator n=1 Tax=Galactobacter valiniphilus TaxID=2676122 RepID=UPI001314A084|nr:ROK family protein [Galactobacter valiniphilus]